MKKFQSRFGKTKTLAQCANHFVMPLAKKQGFAAASFILDWPTIVGENLAKVCEPVKIQWGREAYTPGRLHLLVQSGAAVMVNFQQDIIIQRVNQYFGRRAVETLQIQQGYLKQKPQKAIKLPPENSVASTVDLSEIEDERLRLALQSLGRWMT